VNGYGRAERKEEKERVRLRGGVNEDHSEKYEGHY
jgi:hypothetical protein